MSMDIPRAWQVCQATPLEQHDKRCSYRTHQMLCDCHVVTQHREYKRKTLYGLDGQKLAELKQRVIMFQPRFHAAVRAGEKTTTIRLNARCEAGDVLSLRAWSGRPYGKDTTQIVLRQAECCRVTRVHLSIEEGSLRISMLKARGAMWVVLNPEEREILARHEGFKDGYDMMDWFEQHHKLSTSPEGIEGDLIAWKPLQ